MADQFEETIRLNYDVAEGLAAQAKFNAGLAAGESRATALAKAAEAATDREVKRILSVTQASQAAINRVASAAERRAQFVASANDPFAAALNRTKIDLARVAGDQAAINRVLAASRLEYEGIAAAAKKAAEAQGLFSRSTAGGRALLGIKDLFEGRTSYGQVELGTAVSKLSGGAFAAAGIGLVVGAIAIGLAKMTVTEAAAAKETQNLGIRLGSTSEQAFKLEAQAKLTGVNVDGLSSFMRTLSKSLADGGEEGKRGAEGLRAIGVEGRDAAGNIKPTVQLINEISAGLKGLDTKTAEAKLAEFGGRGAVELLPFFQNLDKANNALAKIGFSIKGGLIDKLADAHDQLQLFNVAWDLLKAKVAEKVLGIVEVVVNVRSAAGGGSPNPRGIALSEGGRAAADALSLPGLPGPAAPSASFIIQGASDSIAKGNALLDARANALNTIEGLQAQITIDQEKYNEAQAKTLGRGQFLSAVQAEIADADKAASVLRLHKEALQQLQEQESARLNFGRKATDELYDAEKKLYDLRAGQANKELAFNGAPTNVSKVLADFNDQVKKETTAQNVFAATHGGPLVSEASIAQKLAPNRTALLIAAAIEDNNIRRKYFIDETEYEATVRQEQSEAQFRRDVEISDKLREIRSSTEKSAIQFEDTLAQESRDRQLRAIENTDAKTLQAKVGYIIAAAKIEEDYAQKSADVRLKLAQKEADEKIAIYQAEFKGNQISAEEAGLLIGEEYKKLNQAQLQSAIETTDKITAYQETGANKAQEAIRDANTRTFDSLKSALGRIFDSFGQKGGLGKLLKETLLGGVKDIASTQGARLLTEAATGQHVGLVGATPANTVFGKFLQLLGIGVKPTSQDKLSNVAVTDGAMHVLVTNPQDISSVSVKSTNVSSPINIGGGGGGVGGFGGGGGSFRSPLAASMALALGLGGGVSGFGGGGGGTPSVSSSITFGGEAGGGGFNGSAGAPDLAAAALGNALGGGAGGFGGPIGSGGNGGPTLGGAPFGLDSLPSSLRRSTPGLFGSLTTGLGKLSLSSLLKGGLSGLKNSFFDSSLAAQLNYGNGGIGSIAGGILGSPGVGAIGASLLGLSTVNVHGAPLRSGVQAGLGGALFGAGALKGLASSTPGIGGLAGGTLLGVGGGLLLNGLQRGGIGGLLEDTAGGAAIGLKFGGPIGAAIGAGVGALAGAIRFAIPTQAQQIHDKVQSIYGVNITSQSILSQLGQLANQSFNGNITTAVTSQQGRQLLQLYAQSTGQKATGILATPQAATFANQGGNLTELPTYFNGQAVYPGQTQTTIGNPVISPTGLLTGFSPIPGGANTNPQSTVISLDGDATTALLSGNAVQTMQGNPRLISTLTTVGQTESANQRYSAASSLAPTQSLS